jgi:uncharacterized protein YhbP (UPF0306 family)
MDERIIEFIDSHHVLTLATTTGTFPYCANCFYVYLPDENTFVFASDTATIHGSSMLQNPQVAASIVLETKTVGKIQGLQPQSISICRSKTSRVVAIKNRILQTYRQPIGFWQENNLGRTPADQKLKSLPRCNAS